MEQELATILERFLELISSVTELELSLAGMGILALALAAMTFKYRNLKSRYQNAEAQLLERSIGTHSKNWTATALNLEKKAQEPGEVARSSALTYLHMLDEAADAWLKGSQWQDALRVTQQLLVECCHAIGKPGFGENEFRAAADLIELRLSTYADLSLAANQAAENSHMFLAELDTMLSLHDPAPRVLQLRDQVANVGATITAASRKRKRRWLI